MKFPKEILHLFNTKSIDNDWSFVEYKPLKLYEALRKHLKKMQMTVRY